MRFRTERVNGSPWDNDDDCNNNGHNVDDNDNDNNNIVNNIDVVILYVLMTSNGIAMGPVNDREIDDRRMLSLSKFLHSTLMILDPLETKVWINIRSWLPE